MTDHTTLSLLVAQHAEKIGRPLTNDEIDRIRRAWSHGTYAAEAMARVQVNAALRNALENIKP